MSDLLRRAGPPGVNGAIVSVSPAAASAATQTAAWRFVSLAVHRLASGAVVRRAADDQEVLIIVLEGSAEVVAGDRSFGTVGGRTNVFDGGPPGLVLLEPGLDATVSCAGGTDALVAVAAAPGGSVRSTRSIDAGDVFVETRGSGGTERRIHHLLPPGAEAGRLIAYEVFTPGGNWSSFPPHKHDTDDPPREAYLEEVYFYRFERPTGFAFQRVYSADRSLDVALAVADCDLVLVPRGYHVVSAAAGYDCYYLNVMAGPAREWHFTVDPDHAWLMDWDPRRPR